MCYKSILWNISFIEKIILDRNIYLYNKISISIFYTYIKSRNYIKSYLKIVFFSTRLHVTFSSNKIIQFFLFKSILRYASLSQIWKRSIYFWRNEVNNYILIQYKFWARIECCSFLSREAFYFKLRELLPPINSLYFNLIWRCWRD